MTSIVAVITCFNRKEVTLASVRSLLRQAGEADVDLKVSLVDDCSPDGTGAAIKAEFPDVLVTDGTGDLFWSGGMRLAYKRSLSAGWRPLAYLLLNDDVVLQQDALRSTWAQFSTELDETPRILVGATVGDEGEVTYAGFDWTSPWRPLALRQVHHWERDLSCDTFNGNYVLIPAEAMRALDGVAHGYQHELGDIDLGLRARKLGVPSFVRAEPVGVCRKGLPLDQLVRNNKSRRARLRSLFLHPHGIGPYVRFVRQHRPKILFPLYVAIAVIKRAKAAL